MQCNKAQCVWLELWDCEYDVRGCGSHRQANTAKTKYSRLQKEYNR